RITLSANRAALCESRGGCIGSKPRRSITGVRAGDAARSRRPLSPRAESLGRAIRHARDCPSTAFVATVRSVTTGAECSGVSRRPTFGRKNPAGTPIEKAVVWDLREVALPRGASGRQVPRPGVVDVDAGDSGRVLQMSLDRTGGHRRPRCRAFRPALDGGLESRFLLSTTTGAFLLKHPKAGFAFIHNAPKFVNGSAAHPFPVARVPRGPGIATEVAHGGMSSIIATPDGSRFIVQVTQFIPTPGGNQGATSPNAQNPIQGEIPGTS